MAWETRVQSQVQSYQRLKKGYLMPPCLTLRIIRYGSRVKWGNPRKGVAYSPTSYCWRNWKGSLWVTLSYGCQLYIYIYIYVCIVCMCVYVCVWWVNFYLNYPQMKITLTTHFIRYIHQNILIYDRLNLYK